MVRLSHRDAAVDAAQRLVESLRDPVDVDGVDIDTSVSVGIAIPHVESDLPKLTQRADRALYRSKQRGGNGYSF